MNININSIFEQKLNEIQKSIPQIPDIKTKFSDYLNRANASNADVSSNSEVLTEENSDKDTSLDILNYIVQSNSLLNTNSLLGDTSSLTSGTSSNLTTLLALNEYKNASKNNAE